MPEGTHAQTVHAPIHEVWSLVSNINQWAPLMPGYDNHEILNDAESKWAFFGNIGIIKKKVMMKVKITEWSEPTRVTFVLTGLNVNFKGQGFFSAQSDSDDATEMTGHLEINAKGLKAPAINQALKSFVPKQTKKLTEAMAQKVTGSIYHHRQLGT